MKRYINEFWLCTLLMFIVASCSDSDSPAEPEPVIPAKITLDSEKEQIVTDQSNQITIAFTANKEWTLSSNQSWCTPSVKNGGAGKITVPVTIDKNETYDSREAVMTIQSGSVKQSVKVTQAQLDAIILAKNSYEVVAEQSELAFELQSNVDFAVECDVDWMKQVTEKGRALTTHKLLFTVDANTEPADREGHILVSKGNLKQVITVAQKGHKSQILTITHELNSFQIPLLEGTVTNAKINWGDGVEDSYKQDAQHVYEASGKHTVTVVVDGADGMSMKSVEGVVDIDLSQF